MANGSTQAAGVEGSIKIELHGPVEELQEHLVRLQPPDGPDPALPAAAPPPSSPAAGYAPAEPVAASDTLPSADPAAASLPSADALPRLMPGQAPPSAIKKALVGGGIGLTVVMLLLLLAGAGGFVLVLLAAGLIATAAGLYM